MTSERECYGYIVPPGATSFVTAGRFRTRAVDGVRVGEFVYRRAYRERTGAVELEPVELMLHGASQAYSTSRKSGFFGNEPSGRRGYGRNLPANRFTSVSKYGLKRCQS